MLPDRPQGQRMKGSGMLGSWCRVETWAAGRAEHPEVPGRGGCKEFLKDFEPVRSSAWKTHQGKHETQLAALGGPGAG